MVKVRYGPSFKFSLTYLVRRAEDLVAFNRFNTRIAPISLTMPISDSVSGFIVKGSLSFSCHMGGSQFTCVRRLNKLISNEQTRFYATLIEALISKRAAMWLCEIGSGTFQHVENLITGRKFSTAQFLSVSAFSICLRIVRLSHSSSYKIL